MTDNESIRRGNGAHDPSVSVTYRACLHMSGVFPQSFRVTMQSFGLISLERVTPGHSVGFVGSIPVCRNGEHASCPSCKEYSTSGTSIAPGFTVLARSRPVSTKPDFS